MGLLKITSVTPNLSFVCLCDPFLVEHCSRRSRESGRRRRAKEEEGVRAPEEVWGLCCTARPL